MPKVQSALGAAQSKQAGTQGTLQKPEPEEQRPMKKTQEEL